MTLAIACCIGGVIMSPEYVSFLTETHGYTFRSGSLDREFSTGSGVIAPGALGTFASPILYLLNLPGQSRAWPETDVSMSNLYMGALIVILAVGSLVVRASRWRWWLALVALFFACCAVGRHLPVRGWLYDLVPPTRYFRMPALFRAYVIVIFCVLAAYAARDLERVWEEKSVAQKKRWFITAGVVAVGAGITCKILLGLAPLTLGNLHFAVFHLVFTWTAAVLIFLLWWQRRLAGRIFVFSLILLAVFDLESTLFLSRPTIYAEDTVASWWQAMSHDHIRNLDLTSNGLVRHLHPSENLGAYPNNRNVATKDSVLWNTGPLKNKFFNQMVTDPALGEMAIGSHRIWFSARPVWAPPSDGNFAAFAEAIRRLGKPILVLHRRREMENALGSEICGNCRHTTPV